MTPERQDERAAHIEWVVYKVGRRIRNHVLVAFTIVMVLVGLLGMVVRNSVEISKEALRNSIQNQANIDASNRQLLEYMQVTVSRWDKLSHDNPKIKVPSASIPPPGAVAPTDAELTRPKDQKAAQSVSTPRLRKRATPAPTPRPPPLQRIFGH